MLNPALSVPVLGGCSFFSCKYFVNSENGVYFWKEMWYTTFACDASATDTRSADKRIAGNPPESLHPPLAWYTENKFMR